MPNIVSWNVNSIKSRLLHLQNFVEQYHPEVILLQETKCTNDNFPYMEIEDMGYNIAVSGQKSYNGVAILSKAPINDITTQLTNDPSDEQARYIEGLTTINGLTIRVASVYVPHGTDTKSIRFQYKMDFYNRLNLHFQNLLQFEEIFIAGGDYNVAPDEIDVYDAKYLDGKLGFHLEERKWIRTIMNNGMYDSFRLANPDKHEYSWWDYRSGGWQHHKGMRIDHILISPQACDKLLEAGIYSQVRGWDKASDHAPIYCMLTDNS